MSEIAPATAFLSFIERAARDPEFDVQKFSLLLDKQAEMVREQSRREYYAAMALCQAKMEPVLRGTQNPGTRSKYARLEDIDGQMRPIYTAHGFSVTFGSDQPPQPGWLRVNCTVAHTGGYFETNYLDGPVSTMGSQGGRIAMTGIQAIGSATTYLRRYLLSLVFNIVLTDIAGEDDDGESLRAVAAATQRAPRIAERAAAYEAPQTPVQRVTLRQWLDEFEARCAAAQTQDEGDRILREEAVLRLDDPALQINENVRSRALAVRKAMVKRLWPDEPPEDEAEPEPLEIIGQDKVAAG